jgi:hypothetical protein
MGKIIGSKIITEGIVLYLDIKNKRSYDSNCNKLVNLCNNKEIECPIKNPVYLGDCLHLNGVDQYINTGLVVPNEKRNGICVCAWFKGSDFSFGYTNANNFYVSYEHGVGLGKSEGDGRLPVILSENWFFVCLNVSPNGQYKLIINDGVVVSGVGEGWVDVGEMGEIYIGSINGINGPLVFSDTNLGAFKVYNRQLTESEIMENYRGLLYRFNGETV